MTTNPVAAMCDKIETHVADRERDLIERLANALRELRCVDRKFYRDFATILNTRCEADNAIEAADAYLAETVRIEVDAAYGEAR